MMTLADLVQKYSQERELVDRPCPLCGSSGSDLELSRRGYPGVPVRNVICKGCGLIRINPRMTDEDYVDFYKKDFFTYLNPYNRPAYVDTFELTTSLQGKTPFETKVLPYILPYVKKGGRVLDVGAGFGHVLYVLSHERQTSSVGIEPDPYSRQIAEEKMSITLLDMTLEDYVKGNPGKFDYVHLDQVLEHLLDPLEALRSIARLLTKDGFLYVGVPNSFNPGVAMTKYYELAHTYGYTPATLGKLAARAGLKVVSIRDPFGSALEAIMALSDSASPTESEKVLRYGSLWWITVMRLKRKSILNRVRGFARESFSSLFGQEFTDKVRNYIDRLIRYRY